MWPKPPLNVTDNSEMVTNSTAQTVRPTVLMRMENKLTKRLHKHQCAIKCHKERFQILMHRVEVAHRFGYKSAADTSHDKSKGA